MTLERFHTDAAPAAIGPYSQAVKVGNLLFCSGQIPLDPATMEMVGDTASAQCEQVMRNIQNLLDAAGCGMDRVARTTIFLTSMSDFGDVNEVYAKHFGDHKPARACVAVKELPKGALVEIDCIASL